MNRLGILLGVLAYLIAARAGVAGDVHGHVLITKALTKKRLALPDYQLRGVALPVHPSEPSPSAIDEFSRVVVYLDGAPGSGGLQPETPVTAKLVQEDTHFTPEILIVPVGSTVSFPNEDPIFHNVFSLSRIKQFDLGYYPAGQTRTVKFDKPGVVQVYCHIHRDMNAAIVVTPNRWFTQPEKDGSFTLADVPAGTQEIVIWHKSVGYFRKRVEVPERGSTEFSVEIPVPSTE